jgi:hypothetical protein
MSPSSHVGLDIQVMLHLLYSLLRAASKTLWNRVRFKCRIINDYNLIMKKLESLVFFALRKEDLEMKLS